MAYFRTEKVIAGLPSTLAPDTLYFVRSGTGYKQYLTDTTGSIAYEQNGLSSRGSATLDFGSGSKTTEVTVTGIPSITNDSVVFVEMKMEATADHSIDELLIDPIRLAIKDLVVGQGFTIYGEMDNAEANGEYIIHWSSV